MKYKKLTPGAAYKKPKKVSSGSSGAKKKKRPVDAATRKRSR